MAMLASMLCSHVEVARMSERQIKDVQFAFLSETVLFLAMSGPDRPVLRAEDTVFWMSIRYPFITVHLNFLTLVLSVNILGIVICEGIVLRAVGRQTQIKLSLNICHFTLSPESLLLQRRKQKQLIGTWKCFGFLPAGSDGNELQPLAILAVLLCPKANIFPQQTLLHTFIFFQGCGAVGFTLSGSHHLAVSKSLFLLMCFQIFWNIKGWMALGRNQIQKLSGSCLTSLGIIFSFLRLN